MNWNGKKIELNSLSNWQFFLLMIFMVFVWAFAFPFIKIGLNELSFINLTIMRFFVVCVIMLIILLLQPKKFSKLYKKDIIPIFVLGFFGVITYHLGLNYGEQYISPGAASLIIATIPVLIVILAFVFLKEKISSKKLLGIIIALFGVLVISIWGKQDASIEINYIFGALGVFIAAVMGAFYTIAGKKLLDRYSALSLTIYAMLLGSLGLIPFINNSLLKEVAAMTSSAWFAVIFLGLFSTIIGYVIWYAALKIKTASEISIYLYAIPVISTIISYFLFGDKITLSFVIGGVFVIAGLAIVNIQKRQNSSV
ncbi:MAG: DMT family transporter [Thermoplasmatales archaeon]|nr:MAG: DMT family transporter [Thermoplasmatales archaeon]